jgi:hypothetical protein
MPTSVPEPCLYPSHVAIARSFRPPSSTRPPFASSYPGYQSRAFSCPLGYCLRPTPGSWTSAPVFSPPATRLSLLSVDAPSSAIALALSSEALSCAGRPPLLLWIYILLPPLRKKRVLTLQHVPEVGDLLDQVLACEESCRCRWRRSALL